MELLNKFDNAALIILKIQNMATNCCKSSLQILDKAYHIADMRITQEKNNTSNFIKFTNYTKSFFSANCEIDAFPFEFDDFQACILEVIRFLHFIYDFDEHIRGENSYLNIIESLKKIMESKVIELEKLKITTEDMRTTIIFLKSVFPMTQLFAKLIIINGEEYIDLHKKTLSRVIIICCMTLHK